jgi:type I site-specific restriction endonuclease
VFHDGTGTSATTEATLALDSFPSPADLWARYRAWKGLTPKAEEIVLQDYFDDSSGKTPRCYQCNAVNAAVDQKRRIDTAYEIYLGLYQAITGPEERQKLFREFSPGFFDLIVVDECHRGSAAEDSAWREILEYPLPCLP